MDRIGAGWHRRLSSRAVFISSGWIVRGADRRALQDGCLICRAGRVHRATCRQDDPQPLIVHKEMGLVSPNRTADAGSPLICVIEWAGRQIRWVMLVHPVVRIQQPAVPEICRVAMKMIGSRAGDLIYLCAAQSAEGRIVCIINDA